MEKMYMTPWIKKIDAVPQEIQNYDEVSVFIFCSFSGNPFSREVIACSSANKISLEEGGPGARLSIKSPVWNFCTCL